MEGISLISTLAIGFGVALVLGFFGRKIKSAGIGRLLARRYFGFAVGIRL